MQTNNDNSNETNNPTLKMERFKFTGKGSEYFGIWIVNILLSIITLGIYSAWAKVRNKQYFYGNTFLDNSSFEYTAKPTQILKGRIVAIVLFFAYQAIAAYQPVIGLIIALLILIATPWIIMKSLAFNARYSQYKNIRFSFDQNFKESIKVILLIPLAMIIPFVLAGIASGASDGNSTVMSISILLSLVCVFLIYPYVAYKTNHYFIDHHNFGDTHFKLSLDSAKPFYAIYLKAAAILIVGGLIVIAISAAIGFGLSDFSASRANQFDFKILFIQLPIIALYLFVFAYISSQIYNLNYQHTQLGKHKLRANMSTKGLMWIYFSNTLGIILTLGLFIPWAKVRSANYRADHTALQVNGDLNNFVATEEQNQSAFGEEMGEIFDIGLGI